MNRPKVGLYLASIVILLACISCSNINVIDDDSSLKDKTYKREERSNIGTLFGSDLTNINYNQGHTSSTPSIKVNYYLWSATLETLSFLPLDIVNPFAGVISTKWYTTPYQANERIKVDARILSSQMRVDSLKISVFVQKYEKNQWKDIPSAPLVNQQLEDVILTRARELKIQLEQ